MTIPGVKAVALQAGISVTPGNNFLLDASADDGTLVVKREDGTPILTINANGVPTIEKPPYIKKSAGSFGGAIAFEKSGDSILGGDPRIENYTNLIRLYVNGGSYKGAVLDLTECADNAGSWLFHQGNILGSVGQSGGVPTGKIIERGNNTNGYYTKFADGTMIASHVVTLPTWAAGSHSSLVWTFPAVFSGGIQSLQATLATGTPELYDASMTFNSQSAATVHGGGTFSTAGSAYVLALGRWF